jgi:hypothetical protein
MIQSLKGKGILEAQEGTDYLRTTELWHDSIEVFRDKRERKDAGVLADLH